MKTILFAYDFPHKKSVDFLLRMCVSGHRPELVVGAPFKQLENADPQSDRHRNFDALHIREVCHLLDVPYVAAEHRVGFFELDAALGVVGGARILPKTLIESFSAGVLNFHQGLLPMNRGLGSLKGAIARDLPMAVTAHLVDERVDAGTILEQFLVPVFSGDSLIEIDLRLFGAINLVLPYVLNRLDQGKLDGVPIPRPCTYPPSRPESVDGLAAQKWRPYVAQWATDTNGWRCICGKILVDSLHCVCGESYATFGPLLRRNL